MRVITIANLKGGTGKTSIAVNLAAGLARRSGPQGDKVVLMDMDPQGNALKTISGTTQYTNTESLAAAIADDALLELLSLPRPPLNSLVRQAPESWYPNLHFIPCREAMLVEVRRRMPAIENRVALMQAAIGSLKAYDYVVIDTGPSIDDLLVTILQATDHIIVPVEMDEHAVEGAARISRKVAEIVSPAGKPRILGYVGNKYVERHLGDRNVMEALHQLFNSAVYETVIPSSIDIRYSQAARTDIYRFSPSSAGSVAMALVVEETLKRLGVTSPAAALKKSLPA